jgi:hypothetical protein
MAGVGGLPGWRGRSALESDPSGIGSSEWRALGSGDDYWVRARYLGHLGFPFFLCGSVLDLLRIICSELGALGSMERSPVATSRMNV